MLLRREGPCPRLETFDVVRASATDGGPLPAAKIGKCIFVKGPRARRHQGRGGSATGFTFFSSRKVNPLIITSVLGQASHRIQTECAVADSPFPCGEFSKVLTGGPGPFPPWKIIFWENIFFDLADGISQKSTQAGSNCEKKIWGKFEKNPGKFPGKNPGTSEPS